MRQYLRNILANFHEHGWKFSPYKLFKKRSLFKKKNLEFLALKKSTVSAPHLSPCHAVVLPINKTQYITPCWVSWKRTPFKFAYFVKGIFARSHIFLKTVAQENLQSIKRKGSVSRMMPTPTPQNSSLSYIYSWRSYLL